MQSLSLLGTTLLTYLKYVEEYGGEDDAETHIELARSTAEENLFNWFLSIGHTAMDARERAILLLTDSTK